MTDQQRADLRRGTDRVSAVSVLAAFDLLRLPELLGRDPSIGVVLSGSKPVDYYVRRCYPSLRVVRVASQRCRLPMNLLLGWWGARRIRRRRVPDRVYLSAAYYCTGVMTAVTLLRIMDLVVNRYEDPDDHFREHPPGTLPRRLALRFMRRVLKLPVTYYSWGSHGSAGNIVGLAPEFLARTEAFSLARQQCDLGLLRRIDVALPAGPQLVWLLSGWEHKLVSDFGVVFARVNRELRRCGYSYVVKQHPSFNLPRGARGLCIRKLPRHIPGDLIRFPEGTIVIGMFSTALTAYTELPAISIARLCRPRDRDLFLSLMRQVRRLSASIRFVSSVEELVEVAGSPMLGSTATPSKEVT